MFQFNPENYPEQPGCYIMISETGRILYIGKSKKLRSRLKSYFRSIQPHKRLRELVSQIASIEIMLVGTEHESLLLENNLIKIHKPPYNRALKRENSGYAYLKLTGEKYPRLDTAYRDRRLASEGRNRVDKDESSPYEPEKRFGPYASSRFRNAVMEFITEHYGLRTCVRLPKRACLLYHIGKCSGVCEGHVTDNEYTDSAREVAELLGNRGEKLTQVMRERMLDYSERLEFEKANHMLHHIQILERPETHQIVDREADVDQDVVYFGEEWVLIAKVQEGMLRDFTLLEAANCTDAAVCDRLLIDYYRQPDKDRPDELIVNRVGSLAHIRRALKVKGKNPIKIHLPKRGLRFELLQMCQANLEYRTGALPIKS